MERAIVVENRAGLAAENLSPLAGVLKRATLHQACRRLAGGARSADCTGGNGDAGRVQP